jgi:hypothetical protein
VGITATIVGIEKAALLFGDRGRHVLKVIIAPP